MIKLYRFLKYAALAVGSVALLFGACNLAGASNDETSMSLSSTYVSEYVDNFFFWISIFLICALLFFVFLSLERSAEEKKIFGRKIRRKKAFRLRGT